MRPSTTRNSTPAPWGAASDDIPDRRRTLLMLGGGVAALTVGTTLLRPGHALAQLVSEDDDRIQAEDIVYRGESGEMLGYLVMPAGLQEPRPGVVVIHENRGQDSYIRDVARRLAIDGFIALAPDMLSIRGGTPDDRKEARELTRSLKPADLRGDLRETSRFLASHEYCTGTVGSIGFAWGGRMALFNAASDPDLAAAVNFYSPGVNRRVIKDIRARLLLHYAAEDERSMTRMPKFESQLQNAGIDYQIYVYEGVRRGFHNDTGRRYDAEAAELAWNRTVVFLAETLGLVVSDTPESGTEDENEDDAPGRRPRRPGEDREKRRDDGSDEDLDDDDMSDQSDEDADTASEEPPTRDSRKAKGK